MFYTEQQVKSLENQQFAHVLYEQNEHIFTITLNRPEKKNALNPLLMNEIAFLIAHAKFNPNIRVVILKSNGTIFCAGADLKAFAGKDTEKKSTVPEPAVSVKLGDVFAQLYKPCIAQVHASVYAGGFLLLGGCTHVIAVEQAEFGLPEVKRGLWPFQVMASLMPFMSARTLLDWCMRGKVLKANEALKTGIVTQVVEVVNLESIVDELAQELALVAPLAVRKGLEAYHEMQKLPTPDQHAYLHGMLQELLNSEDTREGLAAFAEKRNPNWKGI
jgi:enoyl-CoA hydratase/carnithine racemase